jgi:hypothetical protein
LFRLAVPAFVPSLTLRIDNAYLQVATAGSYSYIFHIIEFCSGIAIYAKAIPTQVTDWEWLFNSDFSPLRRFEDHELTGYTNAVTKERINWRQVKEYSTYICTALVKKYGLKDGHTVSLFSQNSIWYPVVMYGVLRAGVIVLHNYLNNGTLMEI